MVDQRVLVIPGAFQLVKNYSGFDGIDIWVAESAEKKIMKRPTFVVAHSAGANFALPAEPTTKKCPECLNEIPIGAKRCGFCTSAVK